MTKNLKFSFSLLASGMLFAGCFSMPAQAAESISISIDKADVSLAQLKELNYEVPIFVRLNQNVSLNAVEFGLAVDSRCRFDIVTKSQYSELYGEQISMEMSDILIPGADNCAWMTWAKLTAYSQKNSNLAMLLIKIPESAQENDIYEIRYLEKSPVNEEKTHLWFNYETLTDYSKNGAVVWSNGQVQITGSSESDFIAGDVTLDGDVDILDVITLNKAILGKEVLTDSQNQAADMDGDNKPTSNDSLMILKKIVGLLD